MGHGRIRPLGPPLTRSASVTTNRHVTAGSQYGCLQSSLSFWRISLSRCDISLIDFEKFRCYCSLSLSVGFYFCYHRVVSASGRLWSGASSSFRIWNSSPTTRGRTADRKASIIDLFSTCAGLWSSSAGYHIQRKHGLCAEIHGLDI